jgi:hypothetical protein
MTMKKIPLTIAVASLFSVSTSFSAADSELTSPSDTHQVQIFKQTFNVRVKKESEIIIDPPQREIIDIHTDKLEDMAKSGEEISIGSMKVESTAKTCYAKVSTMNNFKLQGVKKRNKEGKKNTLAAYALYYTVENKAGIETMDAKFTANNDKEKVVDCSRADLKMKVFGHNPNIPADTYNDVITVEVRAES